MQQALIQKIITNNPEGVAAKLLAEKAILPGSYSVSQLAAAVQEKLAGMATGDWADYLFKLLDVPVNMLGMYADELQALKAQYGLSPAGVLHRDLKTASSVSSEEIVKSLEPISAPSWLGAAFTICAIIGFVVVVRVLVRAIVRISE